MSKSLMSHQNKVIEKIARKSLLCLAFTFVVNLAMNLIKVTELLGNHSDVSNIPCCTNMNCGETELYCY